MKISFTKILFVTVLFSVIFVTSTLENDVLELKHFNTENIVKIGHQLPAPVKNDLQITKKVRSVITKYQKKVPAESVSIVFSTIYEKLQLEIKSTSSQHTFHSFHSNGKRAPPIC